MKTIILAALLLPFLLHAQDIIPPDAPTVVLEGKKVAEFSDTGLKICRRISLDINGKAEEAALFTPVLLRRGSLYLAPATADRLLGLRTRLAEYRKKSEELQKLGDSIKNEYLNIIAEARPEVSLQE